MMIRRTKRRLEEMCSEFIRESARKAGIKG